MRIENILAHKGRRLATIDPDDRVSDAIDLLADWGVGALVVSSDKEHIDGIISERDVVRSLARENEWTLRLRVADLMTAEVVTCTVDDTVDSLMALMTENRIRHVPVVDGDVLVGIVSIGDIVNHRVRELESEAEAMHEYIATGR